MSTDPTTSSTSLKERAGLTEPSEAIAASENAPVAPPQRLTQVLRGVLRPLVRLMLAQGVTFRPASDLLNQIYVEVATAELEREGKKPTDSRLTLMTGIHRKALRQHREQGGCESSEPRFVALGAQLVSRWTSDVAYCDAEGRPRSLPRRTEAAHDEMSFDDLVRSVSSDVHPRTVLDEWLRLGMVRIEEDKSIHLVTAALAPSRGFEEALWRLGRNVHDHFETAVGNLERSGPSRLERSVHCEGLDPEDVNRLERFAEQEGAKLLAEIRRRASELREEALSAQPHGDLSTRDANEESPPPGHIDMEKKAEKVERVSFGLYFFRGPADPPNDADAHD